MLTVTIDQSEGMSGADIPEQAVKNCVQTPPPCLSPAPARFSHFLLLNDFPPPSRSLEQAILWCMSQTSRDRVNSRRVRTHEKNSGDAVRRLGTIIQSIFCAQSGASSRLTVWKQSGESRYTGAVFRLFLKTFVAPFLPAPLIAPGSPRMFNQRHAYCQLK